MHAPAAEFVGHPDKALVRDDHRLLFFRILGDMVKFFLLTLIPVATLAAAEQIDSSGQEERMRVEGRVEKKYTLQLDAPEGKNYCQAQIWTGYIQKNTIAWVEGEIENPDCAASAGEYTVAIRYRDEDGEVHNVEHVESWQRDDDQNIIFQGEYHIGENVDLMRVRARKIVCICAEPADSGDANSGGEQ